MSDIKVNRELVQRAVAFLEQYKDKEPNKIPEVLTSNDLAKQIDEWDFNFINKTTYEVTFHLINAGVLLELEHLHDLACAKIASFMKGKSPEEVNKEFTIECQLTQDEAKELGLDAN